MKSNKERGVSKFICKRCGKECWRFFSPRIICYDCAISFHLKQIEWLKSEKSRVLAKVADNERKARLFELFKQRVEEREKQGFVSEEEKKEIAREVVSQFAGEASSDENKNGQ